MLRGADTGGTVFLVNHGGTAFGRTSNHTLQVEENEAGLNWQLQLDGRSQAHNDLAISVERQDLPQCSVGFTVAKDKWSANQLHRDIYGLRALYDVSVVNNAANPMTEAHVNTEVARTLAMADAEVRSCKTISKATAQHPPNAKAALSAANMMQGAAAKHIDDLLGGYADNGDGTIGSSGTPSAVGNPDGSGSRSAADEADLRSYVRRVLKRSKRDRNDAVDRALRVAQGNERRTYTNVV